jgi:hypothetical protein
VRRSDDIDRVRTEPADGLDGGSRLRAVGLHDVGVVLARLAQDLRELVLVVEAAEDA